MFIPRSLWLDNQVANVTNNPSVQGLRGRLSNMPSFDTDTGSIGNLMGIPMQGIMGIPVGLVRGLRYGFNRRAYGDTVLRGAIKGMWEGAREGAPLKSVGALVGGVTTTATQLAASTIRHGTVPLAKAAGRGAFQAGKYAVANAPAAIGSTVASAGVGAVTLAAAAAQTSKDLFNMAFSVTNITDPKTGLARKQLGLSKFAQYGMVPAYFGAHAISGAAKAYTEAKLGFITAGELPNMLHNEPNQARSQREISPLKGLDNIAGINFALHKLR